MMDPTEHDLLLAAQHAQEDGIPVYTRSFGMAEHAVSKRRYVVEQINFGAAIGAITLWSPVVHASAQLAAFRKAEYQARTGIVEADSAGLDAVLREFRQWNGDNN